MEVNIIILSFNEVYNRYGAEDGGEDVKMGENRKKGENFCKMFEYSIKTGINEGIKG
jgi:hypothetical protein